MSVTPKLPEKPAHIVEKQKALVAEMSGKENDAAVVVTYVFTGRWSKRKKERETERQREIR